ncbi:MAG: DUF2183 domain-containing protein [Bacteriovoracaceae bacterium]|nr:DUF2183 domain-containing protein [Bacteriovoracaceae bacterium]
MGKVLALTLTLFIQFSTYAQIAVVTDLDDTLKRTNVENTARAAYNAFFTQRIFSNMNTLLDEMSSYVDDIFILSASPKIFNFNIQKLLEEHEIEHTDLFTRKGLEDKFEYKYNKIISVLEMGYEGVILIGDDLELDPAIYDLVKKNHPDKVLSIYIHKVKNSPLPESSTAYFSAYDLGVREYLSGRLTASQARYIGERILDEKKFSNAFPRFTHCPKKGLSEAELPNSLELEQITALVDERIINYCR